MAARGGRGSQTGITPFEWAMRKTTLIPVTFETMLVEELMHAYDILSGEYGKRNLKQEEAVGRAAQNQYRCALGLEQGDMYKLNMGLNSSGIRMTLWFPVPAYTRETNCLEQQPTTQKEFRQ
jgi:hypothetical protein